MLRRKSRLSAAQWVVIFVTTPSRNRHTNVGEVMSRRPIAVTFAAHSLEPLLHCSHRNAQQAPCPDCRDFASRGGGITPVAAQSEIPPSGLGNGNRQNLVRHWSLDYRGRPNSTLKAT